MSPLVELNLTLILFLPWFLVLATMYWLFPRQPRHAARLAYDVAALAVSVCLFLLSVHWSVNHADPEHGRLWPQILATALGYGVFLASLGTAFWIRWRWLHKRP